MERAANFEIHVSGIAFRDLIESAIDVSPVRGGMLLFDNNDDDDNNDNDNNDKSKEGRYAAWKRKRNDTSIRKKLKKLLKETITKHFQVEVESPHRLRCIYAWADKQHQDGKVESVHVDEASGLTRKRYVELDPKISYEEYRAVQLEMFPHLDTVYQELCRGFRMELWLMHGKRRQNLVLKRETLGFLAVVAVLDWIIVIN